MCLFQKVITIIILFLSITIQSQVLNNKDFDFIINSKNIGIREKQVKIDSLLQVNDYTDTVASQLYHDFSRILFKANEKEISISYLIKAVKLRKKNIKGDLLPLKKSLFNLGLYYKKTGAIFKAIDTYKELVALPKEDRLRMKAYSELIFLYEKTGDFKKSMRYFTKSTHYYKLHKDYQNLYKNYMRMSRIYATMGTETYQDEIITFLTKADSLNEYTVISEKDEKIINLRLGNVYEEINKKEKALHYYSKALGISEKLKDSVSISMLNNNMGDLYLKDSLYVKANITLQKSVLYAKNDVESKALAYNTYGAYFLGIKDFEKAKNYFEKAIQLLVHSEEHKQFVNPTINAIKLLPNKLRLLEFIKQKAAYWKIRFNEEQNIEYLKKSLQDYLLADQLLDVIRFDSTEKVSKLYWREKGASLYMEAVTVCQLLNDTAMAYFFMEKNKALLLLEELIDQQSKALSKLPKHLIRKDLQFRQQLIVLEENKERCNDDEIFNLKRAYEQFKDSLYVAFPKYFGLIKELPIITIEEHKRNFISDKAATMQYILNKESGFCLVLCKDEEILFPIKNAALLQEKLSVLSTQLQQPFNTSGQVDAYLKNATGIFNQLIPNETYRKLKGKRLTISADDKLQNIPFEALVTDRKPTEISYLIKSNEINYTYSFSYLLSNSKKIRQAENTFIGFAPQSFQDDSLSVLSNSVSEVSSINEIFSDVVYVKENATISNFKSNFESHKIVHLATHSGSSNTEKPWLAFHDGQVNLNEIYGTQNQADLVVLSACNTSKGELKTGEGVMSLARGFFFSGTNSVISTLWNINDKTTQELMVGFYTNLSNGKSKSEALHQSKLNFLETHQGSMVSPFYWSSFVLIGDANQISIENNFSEVLKYVFFLVVLISVIAGIKKRRNKSIKPN